MRPAQSTTGPGPAAGAPQPLEARPPGGAARLLADLGRVHGRREFLARLVRAGRIRLANDEPGPFVIEAAAVEAAVQEGQFDGLAVFLDHPAFLEGPQVRHLIGVTHSSAYNAGSQAAEATIRFYDGGSSSHSGGNGGNGYADLAVRLLDAIMADRAAGLPLPDVGISLVFWPVWEDGGAVPRRLRAFKKIESADLVFSPAADGRILEALSSYGLVTGGKSAMTEPIRTAVARGHNPTGSPAQQTERPVAGGPTSGQGDDHPLVAQDAAGQLAAWGDAAAREGARGIILASNVPEPARRRLLAREYDSPEAVYSAVEQERQYLAEVSQGSVVALTGGPPRGGRVSQVRTGLDHFQNAVDWIFGVAGASAPEPQLRRTDLLYANLTGDFEFRGVYRPDRVYLAGADTGTLANMAANAMNKVIAMQLALLTHYRWYEYVCAPTPNDGSLHDMQWTSMGGISTLPVVTEGGAYDELEVDDVKETDAFYTYGGYVGITRRMIKNSDIQRIQAVPRALAAASVKTRSAKIAAIFTSSSGVGPTLDQDATALFHANHGNLATTAFGADATAWRAAALECFKQAEVNSGDRIALFPKYCLVPPDLYTTALTVFGYGEGLPATYTPEAQDRGPADPRPVPLAVPHFTDANDWAYVADPRVWPVIHMSFSQDPSGRTFPPPELFAATSESGGLLFTSDTLPIKVRDEFAYGVNGFRGIGKRNVT
jgi:hypothetical protein